MRSITKATATAVVVLGLTLAPLTGGVAAFAADPGPSPTPSVSETVPTAEDPEAPAEQVAEVATTELESAVEEPVADTPADPVVNEVENTEQANAPPAARTSAAPTTYSERVEVTEWHTWQTSLAPGVTKPKDANDVTWPQPHISLGQIAPPCGVWYQQDKYVGTREEIDAVLDGDVLTGPPGPLEDSAVVKEWVFVYGGPCPPPEVVIPTLTWGNPTCFEPGGLVYDGGALESHVNWVTVGHGGPFTAKASPKPGYIFPEGQQTVWEVPDLSKLSPSSPECIIPVPVQFSAEPTPPKCAEDGTFTLPAALPNVTFSLAPAPHGPGVYTLTATAANGLTFEGGDLTKTRQITVLGKTGTQSTNSEADCYVKPPVDEPPAVTPPPVVTPAIIVPAAVVQPIAAPVAPADTLAVTGGSDTEIVTYSVAGLLVLLAGLALVLFRRKSRA